MSFLRKPFDFYYSMKEQTSILPLNEKSRTTFTLAV